MPPFRALALLSFAALLFAGCDNNPNPVPYHKTRPDGSPWRVRYGAMPADPKSFDPQFVYDEVSRTYIEPVYDKLLEYHPLKTEPVEVIPCLLAEMPKREVNADGTVNYLCRLKEGIHFHDDPCFPDGKGREIVAGDVHYVLQRIADPKVESPFFAILEQHIIGLTEVRKNGVKDGKFDYNTPVSGFELIDKYAFRLHLNGPFPQLKYWMAMQTMSPVAREAVEYYDGEVHDGKLRPKFRFYTVGSGPFRMREYVPRQRARYERVEGYHTSVFPSDGFPPKKAEWLKQFTGQSLPLFDEMQISIILETIPAFVLGRQGYLDGITATKDSFASVVTTTGELTPKYKARGMGLEKVVSPGTFFISFNMQDPLVGQNVKLRKALACAYDAREYVQIFYSGVAPLSNQLLPRGLFGYDPQYADPNRFDLERARRLLAEAGYPDGRDAKTGEQLVLSIDEPVDGSEMRERAEYEVSLFERLGIKFKINEGTFARTMERLEQGNFQIGSGTGWMADFPDPENFFFLFYSKNFPREGANYCRYNKPEFDRAYEKMAAMDDGPERLELIKQMNKMLADDCPVIWEFNKAFYVATQPWARWTNNHPMIENGFAKYHQVDPVLRVKYQAEWNRKPLWPLVVLGLCLVAGIAYAVNWNRQNHV